MASTSYGMKLLYTKIAQKMMESKLVVDWHWPKKLDSVVGSCLDVNDYIIMLHIDIPYPHMSSQFTSPTHQPHLHAVGASVGESVGCWNFHWHRG